MKTIKGGIVALLLLGGLSWTSCVDPGQASESLTTVDESVTEETQEQADRLKKIFYQIPSPVEMVSIIKESGSKYDHTVLNKVDNRNSYTTAKSKAINLGIYGADLSYTSVFNQNQESIIYLSAAKQLADELGVSSAFSDETMERVEANLDDRDSLMHIITETFYELDAYLKENDRSSISAQVITGGWIEGLYLASVMIEGGSTEELLMDRLVDQKYALNDLISLNEAYNQGGSLDQVITDLKSLKEVFDKTRPKEIDNTQSMVNGKLVLGADEKLMLEEEDVNKIIVLTKRIRGRYIAS
ncbi:MAG: hypothetical protein HKN45_01465 [Flavobacteriales bacterium]|nr:hypothetical protein [Flavobacteriales bacterium]